MKIRTKDSSEIEVQTAAFLTSDKVPGSFSYSGMARAAKTLVGLSLEGGSYEAPLTEINPYAFNKDIKDAKRAYVGFLREQSSEERDEMQQLIPYITRFESFRPAMSQETFLADNLLGEGVYSRVFRLESDNQAYALRVARKASHDRPLDEVHKHLRASLRVAHLDHVERLIAASYTEGMTLSEIAPGKEIATLSAEEFQEITDEQIKELYDTLATAYELNVGFDAFGRNLFYDSKAGFTIIDLGLIETAHQKEFYGNVRESVEKSIKRGHAGVMRHERILDMNDIARQESELQERLRIVLSQ